MITVEKLESIAKDLPAERTNPAPGHVCLYTAPGGEHCIIGEICFRLGLEVPPPNHPDNKSAVAYLADPERKNRWSGLFSPAAIVWAATAQLMGQLGWPWKLCIETADNSVGEQIKLPRE